MDSYKLDRRQRWATWTAGAAWVLVVSTSCATEPPEDGGLEGTMQPGQTTQTMAGTTAAVGGKAPAAAGTGAKAGTGGSPASTTTGTAGTRAATGGAGAPGTSTAGAAGSATAGASGAAGAAGAAVAAGSAAAGASGTAGTSGSAGSAGGAAGSSGSSAAAGSGGTSTAGAGGSSGASSFKRPCVSDGNEVVFIGDSYSDYAIAHRSMASFVQALAVEDEALTRGDTYRNLAVAGTTLAAPPADIQNQWQTAKAMTPISAVVMTGGGNDVLINNQQCRGEGSEMQPDCQQVVQASLDAAKNLFASMKETGVSDVLYFWYPHIPGGLLTGYERGVSISDYTYPMLEDVAKAASTDTFHVFTIPTVDIFEGHPEYFYSDGLHANDTGTAKIAEAIWKVMKDNCIAQAGGCCAE
jgi:lysophospholipase L1-like esterase